MTTSKHPSEIVITYPVTDSPWLDALFAKANSTMANQNTYFRNYLLATFDWDTVAKRSQPLRGNHVLGLHANAIQRVFDAQGAVFENEVNAERLEVERVVLDKATSQMVIRLVFDTSEYAAFWLDVAKAIELGYDLDRLAPLWAQTPEGIRPPSIEQLMAYDSTAAFEGVTPPGAMDSLTGAASERGVLGAIEEDDIEQWLYEADEFQASSDERRMTMPSDDERMSRIRELISQDLFDEVVQPKRVAFNPEFIEVLTTVLQLPRLRYKYLYTHKGRKPKRGWPGRSLAVAYRRKPAALAPALEPTDKFDADFPF